MELGASLAKMMGSSFIDGRIDLLAVWCLGGWGLRSLIVVVAFDVCRDEI